jgi:cellulose synthase/poly-beta-1,6-N-acetylglucosamine synthase-like glycosyltransferase
MLGLEILFAAAAAIVFYTYAGYPLVLVLLPQRNDDAANGIETWESRAAVLPSATILIPACNEERWIARKIENTLALNYPAELLEILVASDGSVDATAEIARGYAARGISVAAFPSRLGKQEMLNRLVPGARGEIVVMTDTNAILERDSLRALVAPFTDTGVGCAIGRRVCIIQERSVPSVAESFYWQYESWIKRAESRWHSCLAATGQLYAVRRSVFPHVERVGEDFYIPMKILSSTGLRIAYVPEAVAAIPAAANLTIEFERKTRAHVAFLISLPLLKELLMPGCTPVWWQFVSHHVFRMLVPPAMLVALGCSSALAASHPFHFYATLAQICFYVFAFIGWLLVARGVRIKLFYFPFYFVFVQLALAQAWLRWPRKKYDYAWQRTERLPDAS